MSSKTIAHNSFYILIARGVDSLGGILLVFLTARYLIENFGIDANGQYAFLVTLIGLIFTLANAGLPQIIIRDIARDKSKSSDYLSSAIILRLLLSLICVILLMGLSIYLPMTREMRIGILLAMLGELVNVMAWNFINIFNAYEKMKYEAISSFLFRSFLLLLAVLVILSKIHWLYFFIAQFIAGLIRLIYVVWQSNRLVRPALKIDFHLMRTIFLQALPIGFALLLTQGYLRIDVILLKQLANYREVAYFFYPYRILFELNIIPLALTTALFPVLARAAKSKSGSGINEIENLFIPAFKYYLILSLPIMIFGYLYAMPIMTTFFTEKFRESGPCLQIMIWATFFVFVEVLMSLSLIATGRQRILFFANGACLTTNFLVDYILIQYFHLGAIGASIGTVSAYTVLFLILFYRIRETVSLRKVIHQIPRPLIAGLICGIIFYYFRTFSWYYMIPIGFIVYILLLFILRTFNQKEIQMLRDLVRPPGAVET